MGKSWPGFAALLLTLACQRVSPPTQRADDPELAGLGSLDAGAVLAPGPSASALIEGVPHVRQKPDFCGEAVVASVLLKLGQGYSQDQVFDLAGIDPALGKGATTRELKVAVERIGFEPGPVWYSVPARGGLAAVDELFRSMHADLVNGIPSIVCTHFDDQPDTTEHFRLVLGYDAASDELIYHEPAVDHGAYLRMQREQFLKLWPLKYERDRWTVIRFRMAYQRILPASELGTSNARFAQHVLELRDQGRLAPGFSVAVAPPFVVIGDGSTASVRHWAEHTVGWAVQRLKQEYFDKDPEQVLDIWLFEDDDSYRNHATWLFGNEPTTPYGYYSRGDRALVMNIGTGGGTLVHEIVHPYIEANFPGCPAWFNEGLGSLYEQSAERDGRIVGLTNWRLEGLQQAILARRLPSLRVLTGTSSEAFYERDPGTNYAEARYLLYYLQERGLLVRFYREFRRKLSEDASGYRSLQSVLGERDMARFQQRWERYVLGLKFP